MRIIRGQYDADFEKIQVSVNFQIDHNTSTCYVTQCYKLGMLKVARSYLEAHASITFQLASQSTNTDCDAIQNISRAF